MLVLAVVYLSLCVFISAHLPRLSPGERWEVMFPLERTLHFRGKQWNPISILLFLIVIINCRVRVRVGGRQCTVYFYLLFCRVLCDSACRSVGSTVGHFSSKYIHEYTPDCMYDLNGIYRLLCLSGVAPNACVTFVLMLLTASVVCGGDRHCAAWNSGVLRRS